jgi:thiamine biosynthesis lipoprotein
MPLTETLAVGPGIAQWELWSTVARLVVLDPARLDEARRLVEAETAAVELACRRFRPDSEVSQLAAAGAGTHRVGPLLAQLVRVALDAAERTDGDVDPTVGALVRDLGYDRSFELIGDRPRVGTARLVTARLVTARPASWRDVDLDDEQITVPDGVLLDLGATAKAWAAQRCADVVAAVCGTGALVALGGDVATAGPAPDGGWQVRVHDHDDDPTQVVAVPAGAAVATSSTTSRSWRIGERLLHHVVDPRTGQPVTPVWRTVTVVGPDAVTANTLSTAALVRGTAATAWLTAQGAPARLVDAAHRVTCTPGWPPDLPPQSLPGDATSADALLSRSGG